MWGTFYGHSAYIQITFGKCQELAYNLTFTWTLFSCISIIQSSRKVSWRFERGKIIFPYRCEQNSFLTSVLPWEFLMRMGCWTWQTQIRQGQYAILSLAGSQNLCQTIKIFAFLEASTYFLWALYLWLLLCNKCDISWHTKRYHCIIPTIIYNDGKFSGVKKDPKSHAEYEG